MRTIVKIINWFYCLFLKRKIFGKYPELNKVIDSIRFIPESELHTLAKVHRKVSVPFNQYLRNNKETKYKLKMFLDEIHKIANNIDTLSEGLKDVDEDGYELYATLGDIICTYKQIYDKLNNTDIDIDKAAKLSGLRNKYIEYFGSEEKYLKNIRNRLSDKQVKILFSN